LASGRNFQNLNYIISGIREYDPPLSRAEPEITRRSPERLNVARGDIMNCFSDASFGSRVLLLQRFDSSR
jgi:hypothetical protein